MWLHCLEASSKLVVGKHLILRQIQPQLLFSRSGATAAPSFLKKKQPTYYEVLGVKKDATQADIKDAFLNLSKEVHPDLNPEDTSRHGKFVLLNEAYNVLGKHSSRREYDCTMAALLHRQQSVNMYQSYAAGESHAPGQSGTSDYESNTQEEFWDETLWSMRDKDWKSVRPDEYYGIKGVKKLPKLYIVVGCLAFMACGAALHWFAFSWSKSYNTRRIEKQNKENSAFLFETRRRARENGNELQLKLLEATNDRLVRATAASKTAREVKTSTSVPETPS